MEYHFTLLSSSRRPINLSHQEYFITQVPNACGPVINGDRGSGSTYSPRPTLRNSIKARENVLVDIFAFSEDILSQTFGIL